MLKGVIFDYNGTLYPDDTMHDTAWKRTVIKYFPEIKDVNQAIKKAPMINNKIVINYLAELARRLPISEEELKKISYDKEVIYRQLCIENKLDNLMPGAERLLDYLKNNGFKLNICTSSIITNLEFYIKHNNLAKWFAIEKIVYDNEKVTGKCEMYKQAIKNLELLPEECLVFEDSKKSIEEAIQAGIKNLIQINHFNKESYKRKEIIQEIKDFNELDYSIFKK